MFDESWGRCTKKPQYLRLPRDNNDQMKACRRQRYSHRIRPSLQFHGTVRIGLYL